MSDPITFSSIFDPDSTVSVHLGLQDSFVHGQVKMPDSTLPPLSYWGNVFLFDGKIYYKDLVYFGARLGPWWQFDRNVILNSDPIVFENCVVDPTTEECFSDTTTVDTGETLIVRQGGFFAFGAGVDIPVYRAFDLGLSVYGQRDHGEYGNESNPEVLYRATDLTKPRPEYDILQEYERWGGDAEISARFRTKFIDARIGGGGSLGWESTSSTNEGVEDTQSGASHRWHFGLGLEFHAARDGIVPKRKPRAVTSSPTDPVSHPEPRATAVPLPVPEPEPAPVVQGPTRLTEPESQPEPPIPQQLQPEELAEFPEPELPPQEIPPPEPIEEEVVLVQPDPSQRTNEPEVQDSSFGGAVAVYTLDESITKGRGGGNSGYGATDLGLELCSDCALPEVVSGVPTIDGDLDEAAIEITLRPYIENISNCYNIPQELVNKRIEDTVTIKFIINPNGQVDDVDVSFLYMDPRNPYSDLNVENFRKVFSSLEFPRPGDGAGVTVAYPIDFSFYPEPGNEIEPQEMEEQAPGPVLELDFEEEAELQLPPNPEPEPVPTSLPTAAEELPHPVLPTTRLTQPSREYSDDDRAVAEDAGIFGALKENEELDRQLNSREMSEETQRAGSVLVPGGSRPIGTQEGSGGLGDRGHGLGGGGAAEGLGGLGTKGRGNGRSYNGKYTINERLLKIHGDLSAAAINATIEPYLDGISGLPGLDDCYLSGLAGNSDLSGNMVIQVVINSDGSVSDVKVQSSTLANDNVEECFCKRFSIIKFPATETETTAVFEFSFLPQ